MSHMDNGGTCCRARRKVAAPVLRGRVPAWLWVLAPRRLHRLRQLPNPWPQP